VSINQHSTCWTGNPIEKGWYLRHVRRVNGALVYSGRRGFDVYTGTTALNLYGVRALGVAGLVSALRPLGADAPPASLPPPAFGDRVWRKAGREGRATLRALGARHRRC
jgi:hypothetical protein